jgi:hypothetical protein
MPEVVDPVLDRLDVPVEHRAVRANAEMCATRWTSIHSLPASFFSAIVARTPGLNTFCAAAGHRVEPRLAQRDEHVAHGHLLDARDVRDLDRRERLDVHLRMRALRPRNISL